jgi:hypothetical protein
MTRMTLSTRVGSDGVLHVPLGSAAADCAVKVTIEPVLPTAEEQSKYSDWLDSIAGKWQGDFDRMPQVEFERRDSL